jgi:carbonic anhydrase/acetyltransferase-like protein (isoleucine patch superfamily)
MPTVIGDEVSVGHGAVVHACTIGEGALIAIHANVLTGATVGDHSLIGAGAVVAEGTVVPPNSLALGVPAKVKRALIQEDLDRMARTWRNYAKLAQAHKQSVGK